MPSSKPIRALHVFPLFGQELPNGSERYVYRLTKALVAAGVNVEVHTTCAKAACWKGGLSLAWPDEFPKGSHDDEGVTVRRFSTWLSMPRIIGRFAEYLFVRHVHPLRKARGIPDGPNVLPKDCRAIMAIQPRFSDFLGLLCRGPLALSVFVSTWSALRRSDIVLVSFFPLLFVPVVVWMARVRKKPVVILPLFHANDLSNNGRLLGQALARADAVLTLTEHSASYLASIHPSSRTFAVGAGIDPAGLADSISGSRFRVRYDLEDRKIVLFVGRKEEGKRYDLAIDAMRLVSDPSAALVMIGEDVDRKPVDAERVRYLGRLNQVDVWDAFDACDVLVLPSDFESFGLVFLEAWVRGKPVIGNSRCLPVTSVIEDGVDGFLCGDARSIAERVNALLSDPALARTMGEAGRRKVMTKYTWELVAAKVLAVYKDCLDAGG